MEDDTRPLYHPLRVDDEDNGAALIKANERAECRVIAMMNWPQLQRVMEELRSDPRQWNDPAAIIRAVRKRIKALGITERELVQTGYY